MRRVMTALLVLFALTSCREAERFGCGDSGGLETRPARPMLDLAGIVDAMNRSRSPDIVDSICPELLSISMDVKQEYNPSLGGVLIYPPFGLDGFDETLISMTAEEAFSHSKKPEYVLVLKLQKQPDKPMQMIKVDNQPFSLSNEVAPVGYLIRDRQTMELYGRGGQP